MLTSLEIKNFKGIAVRQRIDFAPLTPLFCANSAGKSTILQALLYLHELIERGSADVDRTELGGNVLELGGFARLVHGHESERPIVLRAEFATPGGLKRFGRDLTDFPFPGGRDAQPIRAHGGWRSRSGYGSGQERSGHRADGRPCDPTKGAVCRPLVRIQRRRHGVQVDREYRVLGDAFRGNLMAVAFSGEVASQARV